MLAGIEFKCRHTMVDEGLKLAVLCLDVILARSWKAGRLAHRREGPVPKTKFWEFRVKKNLFLSEMLLKKT